MKKFFEPETVALIGASNEKGSVGYSLMKNLKESKTKVVPINLHDNKIQGVKAYKTILKTRGKIDLAVIAVPAKAVPKVLEECGERKVKNTIIISAGFSEAGNQGLEKEVISIAEEKDITLLGPNCLGVINPRVLNATFFDGMPDQGKISFASQSGALGVAVLDEFIKKGWGFSKFVSVGNMARTGFPKIINYFNKDSKTKVITLYLESLKDGEAFMRACKKSKKPILVLKAGKSDQGASAAKSHTGALAGSHKVYSGAFKQCGALECESLNQLFNAARVVEAYGQNSGSKVLVITNAGGPGVLVTDACAEQGLEVVELPSKVKKKLGKALPSAWSKSNPVDVIGDAPAKRFEEVFKKVGKKFYDYAIIVFTPQSMSEPLKTAKKIVKNKKKLGNVIACFLGGEKVDEAIEHLEEKEVPVFREINSAVEAIKPF